jgi:putative DNA primase/helicase
LGTDGEALRGVINSGHTKTQAYVVRCDGDANEPVKFTTWAAKAIAMIGQLPGTIEDRSIVVSLKRKLPSEHSDRHTLETRQELSILKQSIRVRAIRGI